MFVILLLSCSKNNHNISILKKLWLRRCGVPYVIVTGNASLTKDYFYFPKTKRLVVCSEDDYDHLCDKMHNAFMAITQIFPNVKGIFKIDDDVFLSIPRFHKWIQKTNDIDYAGIRCKMMDYWSYYHYGKCSSAQMNMIPMYLSKIVYAQGPFYFVSRKSINILIKNMKPHEHLYEDYLIGKTLESHGIVFVDAQFYTESLSEFVLGNDSVIAFHDLEHVYNFLKIEQQYSINQLSLKKYYEKHYQNNVLVKVVMIFVIICIAIRLFFLLQVTNLMFPSIKTNNQGSP